jgi:hypothetical protein
MSEDKTVKKYTLAPPVAPFDYTTTAYDGAAKRYFDAYRSIVIYDPVDFAPGTSHVLELGSEPAYTNQKNPIRIGTTDEKVGYRYANSKYSSIPKPQAEMDIIARYLRDHYVAPAEPSLPLRSWWATLPFNDEMNWARALQRMIVACFDDGALAYALSWGDGGKNPKKTYECLFLGLLSKTHFMGAAAPQHFDAMFSVLRWMCSIGKPSDADLKVLFGDLTVPIDDRLRRYSHKLGNMCSGMAGTFARYATASGRPGATVEPIALIPTSSKERADPKSIPKRWNVAGLEDASQFGNGGAEHPALIREIVADVKPGDFIVHDNAELEKKGQKTFNHVAIINTVQQQGDKALISTVESCSDMAIQGMVYTTEVTLENATWKDGKPVRDGKFLYSRLNKVSSRPCFVRRINHWYAGDRHDLTDVQLY